MSLDAEEQAAAVAWMLERPQLRALLERFPPGCKVRAIRPLVCPKPGEVGTVVSYYENGCVSVVVKGNPIRGQCQADWLVVVEYDRWLTPEFVKRVFDKRVEA